MMALGKRGMKMGIWEERADTKTARKSVYGLIGTKMEI